MHQQLILFSWPLLLCIHYFPARTLYLFLDDCMWSLLSLADIHRNYLIRYTVVSLIFFCSQHCCVSVLSFSWNSMLMVCLTIQVPFWISKFFADGFGVPIPTRELFWSLIFTLLIPLVLGKVPSSATSLSYNTEVWV